MVGPGAPNVHQYSTHKNRKLSGQQPCTRPPGLPKLELINSAIMIYRDVSVCIEGRFLQWKTLKDYNQVEKAAGGEMIFFLSHQVFSSEPSFNPDPKSEILI